MRNNLILIYLLVFVAILIFLRALGVIHISNDELLGYVLIIYGLSLFYSSFISGRKIFLFVGSTTFLIGIIFFLFSNFQFQNTHDFILPAIIFILSISSFMVYLSDTTQKISVYIAIILCVLGVGAMALISKNGITGYFINIVFISEIYWPMLIILIVVVMLVNKDSKQ
ncbi:MAG: hypothetical protein O6940_02345 [Ignavibacteria bacterium]|nr:hypothetical protein [Ignavibacteria bacterium]